MYLNGTNVTWFFVFLWRDTYQFNLPSMDFLKLSMYIMKPGDGSYSTAYASQSLLYVTSIWSQPLRYILSSIHTLIPDIRFLWPEVHISGKHGHNTRHLFDIIRKMFIRTRLEFIRHHAIDLSEHVQKFHFGTIVLQNDTQGLDKPWSFLVIPPWIETWKKMDTWWLMWINKHCLHISWLLTVYLLNAYKISNVEQIGFILKDTVSQSYW